MPRMDFANRTVVLGVGGGIAAYKPVRWLGWW
jgi:phosphopantothenoylcysteine synthetase/decarboxylase